MELEGWVAPRALERLWWQPRTPGWKGPLYRWRWMAAWALRQHLVPVEFWRDVYPLAGAAAGGAGLVLAWILGFSIGAEVGVPFAVVGGLSLYLSAETSRRPPCQSKSPKPRP